MNQMSRGVRLGKNSHGFTMIEAVAVMAIVAIFLAMAVSRIPYTQSYSVAAEVDILKTCLRYAQLRALSDNKTWMVSFAGGSYTVWRDEDGDGLKDEGEDDINLPNENSATHFLPGGIAVTGTTVSFDEWGSPGTADVTITVSPGPQMITIHKNTGFIQ